MHRECPCKGRASRGQMDEDLEANDGSCVDGRVSVTVSKWSNTRTQTKEKVWRSRSWELGTTTYYRIISNNSAYHLDRYLTFPQERWRVQNLRTLTNDIQYEYLDYAYEGMVVSNVARAKSGKHEPINKSRDRVYSRLQWRWQLARIFVELGNEWNPIKFWAYRFAQRLAQLKLVFSLWK